MGQSRWLVVSVGNSRQHWGWFSDGTLHTEHHPVDYWDAEVLASVPRIVVASVVPRVLARWRSLPQAHVLQLADLALRGTYPTLGIDRALNLIGVQRHGWPALVVDFGTAITVSAVDTHGGFAGGLILPGLATQLRSLHTATAGLPAVELPDTLPTALAFDTESAMQAGVVRVALAGIGAIVAEWRMATPRGVAVATGGDSPLVARWWPRLFDRHDPDLALWGICRAVRTCGD